jgi:hypothetical protein
MDVVEAAFGTARFIAYFTRKTRGTPTFRRLSWKFQT